MRPSFHWIYLNWENSWDCNWRSLKAIVSFTEQTHTTHPIQNASHVSAFFLRSSYSSMKWDEKKSSDIINIFKTLVTQFRAHCRTYTSMKPRNVLQFRSMSWYFTTKSRNIFMHAILWIRKSSRNIQDILHSMKHKNSSLFV